MFRLALAGDAEHRRRSRTARCCARRARGRGRRAWLPRDRHAAGCTPIAARLPVREARSELESVDVRPLVRQAVDFLAGQRRWDECLLVLEHFPDDELIISTLNEGLAEILDSGRIATVRRWLELATSRRIDEPLLLLADAEIAVRLGEYQRAHVLGEHAGSSLTGDLAARAYLAGARAAHLGDKPTEARKLCERAAGAAVTLKPEMDALWLEFSIALERADLDVRPIFVRLQGANDSTAAHALRLLAAQGFFRYRDGCRSGGRLTSRTCGRRNAGRR